MVVLSAAVVTRSGKVLVSRQFVKMTKLRIEGLLAAFPKLVGSGGQHTFIETENVRYLYQPIEQLYALLITNKQSNIMEDLDTLRLVAKLIPEYCHGQDEAAVSAEAFSLMFALDEVISIGYRENLTLQQVRTFTEMDSHEEKLQKIIKESKEMEARKKMKEEASKIDKHKAELWKIQQGSSSQGGGIGFGGGGSGISGGGGYGGGIGQLDSFVTSSSSASVDVVAEPSRPRPTRAQRAQKGGLGLQLGGKKLGGDDIFAQLANEESLAPSPAGARTPAQAQAGASTAVAASSAHVPAAAAASLPLVEGVLLNVEEVIRVKMDRDGSLKKLDLHGNLLLTIADPDFAKIEIQAELPAVPRALRFQPHPKVDRSLWVNSKRLALKSLGKGFPVGSSNSAPVLKWKMSTDDGQFNPIALNFWPSPENGRLSVNVEYTSESETITLENVSISIPCPGVGSAPEIRAVDGRSHFDSSSSTLIWTVDVIEPDGSGVLEFCCDAIESDTMFPLTVEFTSPNTISGLQITSVELAETKEPIEFEHLSSLRVESFQMD